jgi:hypothetical protein
VRNAKCSNISRDRQETDIRLTGEPRCPESGHVRFGGGRLEKCP